MIRLRMKQQKLTGSMYLWLFAIVYLLISSSGAFASPKTADKEPIPKWTYDEDYTGQEDWGNLNGYEICNSGTKQSPINISHTKIASLPALEFAYKQANAEVHTTNQSFIIIFKNAGTVSEAGETYTLNRIELHTPGEHVLRSELFSMLEINLFHTSKTGKTLIIAIPADIGPENKFFSQVFSQILSKPLSQKVYVAPNSLLPKEHGFYSYEGSLPYPPCTEGIQWRVLKSGITVSGEQLRAITKIVGRNNRLPQPVYMREVLETSY